MTTDNRPREEILAENEELRLRLEEAEETLRAIGSGEADAFVVSGPEGERVFTLKGAEHPYRVLVETMNEGAATLADDGTILYCNKHLAAMLQVPLERLIGTQLGSYVLPADRPLFTARLRKCNEECDKDEITMVTGTGNPVPVMISCCAADLCESRDISMVITDLSQQKRSEEIVASESLARSIIEQAGEAIVVCDEDGRIIQASRLAHRLCGDNPLLKPFNESFQLRIVETECLFSVMTPLHGGSFESVEVEFKRSDDQILHLLLNATPLKNVKNRIIGCVVALTDFTERRQAEEAINRSNALLTGINCILKEALTCGTEKELAEACLMFAEAITDSRFGFIGGIGPDGLLHDIAISETGWDACAMYDSSGQRRQPGNFHIHGLYGRVVLDGRSYFTNDPAIHPDSIGVPEGHPALTAFLGVPLKDGGKTIGLVAVANRKGGYREEELESLEALAPVIVEAFQRKRAEEGLQKAHDELEKRVAKRTAEVREKDQILIQQGRQAAMGEMIGNIAHQWRQPLNTLGLTIQQLLLVYDLRELDREFLEKNVTQSMGLIKHMSRTIDDFRNFFRPDKEKVEFKLAEAVANSLALIEDSFKNKHIAIEVVEKDDPVIFGFPNEFAQALLNILNNARDALTEREIGAPRVTVTICREGERAVVTISDNAGGIAEEIMGKIFDPYFSTKGPQAGTGVGLFMSKTIIEKNMAGRLSARNTADGAEFRIEI